MTTQNFDYRGFSFSAKIDAINNNRAVVTVDVTTSEQRLVDDLGRGRFIHLEQWFEENKPPFLQVVIDDCKVAVDHYVNNIDSGF